LNDFDLAAIKHFKLGERFNLEFRAELFNMFSTPNFSYPHANLSAQAFGSISELNPNNLVQARQVQFAMKLSF